MCPQVACRDSITMIHFRVFYGANVTILGSNDPKNKEQCKKPRRVVCNSASCQCILIILFIFQNHWGYSQCLPADLPLCIHKLQPSCVSADSRQGHWDVRKIRRQVPGGSVQGDSLGGWICLDVKSNQVPT